MNTTLLQQHLDEGDVKRQKHPEADLWIYNYTPQCQYGNKWDNITSLTRGLIMDKDFKVHARPFKKFFNLEQLGKAIPEGPIEITEKMDGSLGILYWVNDTPQIATRGSFDSVQAKVATKMLHNQYKDAIPLLKKWWTYLFEIIYPSNRIVVDYGEKQELVLLAIVETNTGKEMPLSKELGFPLVHTHKETVQDIYELSKLNLPNKEGFVIRWTDSNFRAKVKFEEYVRLHRIVTQVSTKTIWEHLSRGLGLKDILDRVPDEFYKWVLDTKVGLQQRYAEIEKECHEDFGDVPLADSSYPDLRKIQAEFVKTTRHPAILFRMLDGREYDDIIWRMLKPQYETPFKDNGEEI